jgi:hypothetical protein
LNDEELHVAFAVPKETLWFQAVLQRIEFMRDECASKAAEHVSRNNALAAAGANGGYEILTSLLMDMEDQRRVAVTRMSK